MERINLTKYGFKRTPAEDFSDDGNRFTGYTVGKVTISKLVKDGEVYISGSLSGELPHEVYSQLPHYKNLYDLNGVSNSRVTEDALIKFYNDCVSYEQEYDAALSKFAFPTKEQIQTKVDELTAEYNRQITELNKRMVANVNKFILMDEYALKSFRKYYAYLVAERDSLCDRVKSTYMTAYSVGFLKSPANIWYFNECLEILEKNNI